MKTMCFNSLENLSMGPDVNSIYRQIVFCKIGLLRNNRQLCSLRRQKPLQQHVNATVTNLWIWNIRAPSAKARIAIYNRTAANSIIGSYQNVFFYRKVNKRSHLSLQTAFHYSSKLKHTLRERFVFHFRKFFFHTRSCPIGSKASGVSS